MSASAVRASLQRPRELTIRPRCHRRVPNPGGFMDQSVQTFPGLAGSGSLAAERNRVLRNTYWLLALSMVPTVLGAWIGVASGFGRAMTPGMSMIVFFAGA